MKKFRLLSIILCSATLTFAQPTLSWVRPPYGTTKTYNIHSGSMTEPTTGANQIWNYSAISVNNIGAGVYTDPSTLPPSVINKFPTATYVEVWTSPTAPSVEQAIVDFYREYPDSLVRMGQQSSGGSNSSTWGDTQGVWNVSFGGSTNANYQDQGTGQLVSGVFTYAAYGTLSTPYGTYNDVVMITRPGSKLFFRTTPYYGLLMNVIYSSPTTIAGAYVYSYGASSTGINKITDSPVLNIYPNPVSDELTINLETTTTNIVEVINSIGTTILKQAIHSSSTKINTSILSNGIYFVRTTNENNITSTSKFIKN